MSIFHIAHADDWRVAQALGEYRISTRGATLEQVGFIHASSEHQLSGVAQRFYATDEAALLVLELDEDAIRAAGVTLAYEDAGNGELFPHIYGPIRPDYVAGTRAARMDSSGRLIYEGDGS
ncbi:MAG: hypothetical protein QOF36_878 [Microbacteriaceae bacterium]|jgi:uncharacterized protein (DUF952 family)|nr:hypothetical protein [Microbacteriaceae bacterium]